MSLLNLSDLLALLNASSLLHLLISIQRSVNYVSYSTLHLVAELVSLSEIASLDSYLNLSSELSERHLTESRTEGEETLNTECDNGEQQSEDYRYYDTTFVDCTEQVSGLTAVVSTMEVSSVTEESLVESYGQTEANNDDPNCISNSLKALLGGCFFVVAIMLQLIFGY